MQLLLKNCLLNTIKIRAHMVIIKKPLPPRTNPRECLQSDVACKDNDKLIAMVIEKYTEI